MSDLVKNRRAYHDYEVLDTLEAGIELRGSEVKSCRAHNINLSDGYAAIENGEVILRNVHISPYKAAAERENHDPQRPRRLLLHRREIRQLARETMQKGSTLIPLAFVLRNRLVKVKLGICRGRRKGDKREAIRDKEDKRRMQQAMKRRA